MASAIDLNVPVALKETPDRIVTPVNESLLLKDSTVTDISSPDIDGTKHSMLDIIIFALAYQSKLQQCQKRSSDLRILAFEIRSEYTASDICINLGYIPPSSFIHLMEIRAEIIAAYCGKDIDQFTFYL